MDVKELAAKYIELVKSNNDDEAHKLLSGSCFRGQKRLELCPDKYQAMLENKVLSWERTLREERTYEFDRIDEAASDDSRKKVFFKMTKNGATSSKPWIFVKEDDGNWYIDSVLA